MTENMERTSYKVILNAVILLLSFVGVMSVNVHLNHTDEFRLISKLLGHHNLSIVRPVVNSTDPVNVDFQMKLSRLVKVDSKETTLVTDVWITQKWINPFLTWDPKEYGGIEIIHAHPRDVWVPDTALINNAESDFAGSRTKYKTLVVLNHKGVNTWMSPATFKSSCRFDVSFFPFDVQICDLSFGSWTFSTDKMTLSLTTHNLFAATTYKSGDWTIPSMKVDKHSFSLDCCEGSYDRITYKLKLKREPLYFIMYLIVPTVLISLLVLFSFKIPVDSGERIGLCTTALLSMSVFLLLIGEYLPESSKNIPLLAVASVLMMIEITMGFLATILVLKCHHNTTQPPKIVRVLCCVKSSESSASSVDTGEEDPSNKSTVQALMQAQLNLLERKQDKYKQQWQQIAKTLDRAFFYIFLSVLCGTLAGVYLMAPLIAQIEDDM